MKSCVGGGSSREINLRTSVHSTSIVPMVTVGTSSSSSSRSSWKLMILCITPGAIVASSSMFSRREWANAERKYDSACLAAALSFVVGSKNNVTRFLSKSESTMTRVNESLQRDTTAAAWISGMLLSLRALVKTFMSGFANGCS